MFVRSDSLLEKPGEARSLHVLSFDWNGFDPSVTAWDAARSEVVEMNVWNLNMCVTTARRCVGSFDGEDYFPCPTTRRISGPFAQCQSCAGSWIPVQQCTFEPKCDGTLCDSKFCSREHAVYVAFHGALAKVGMCGGHRVAGRLVEQGADAYALVAALPNRLEARRLESAISKEMKMRQRVMSKEALANYVAPPPWQLMEEKWAELGGRISAKTGSPPGKLARLDKYPLAQPLASAPRLRQTIGPHEGKVIGIKGRYVVYENDGLNALDLSDLPARVVKISP
ncbi:MAG: DUF2797 domain-containing protein [Methanobacteriota archaeon]